MVHVAASGNISHRYDPEFDAIFGPSGWGLGNPRFEGSTLVADVVCLGDDRLSGLSAYQVRGGEDGIFDEVVAS